MVRIAPLMSAFVFVSSVASGGGAHTGGSDNLSLGTGAAWFLGDAPITYCYELGPQFGAESAAVEDAIQLSLATWREYILRKSIYLDKTSRHNGATLTATGRLVACSDASVELKFYFGVTNSKIRRDRRQYEDPAAFAQRETYDLHQGRGTGYVWVAAQGTVLPESGYPNWQQPYALEGMLTHEWGHIFGNDHVSGTIMSADMTQLIGQAQRELDQGKKLLTSVDGERELALCGYQCEGTYTGALGLEKDKEVPATFKLLVGRAPRGEIKATVRTKTPTTTLTLSDDIDSRSFDLGTSDGGTAFVSDSDIFHVAKITGPGENGFGIHMHSYGEVFYGTIKSFDGAIFPVTVERNTDSRGGPLRIFFFSGGKKQSLFLKPYQSLPDNLPIVPIR